VVDSARRKFAVDGRVQRPASISLTQLPISSIQQPLSPVSHLASRRASSYRAARRICAKRTERVPPRGLAVEGDRSWAPPRLLASATAPESF